MNIDWITFAAQIVNLAILVYLLYRFLFKPLLTAIDNREATIKAEVEKSKTAVEQAEKRLAELNKKHEKIEVERKAVLNQAHRDAEDLRVRLETEARDAAEQTRARWQHDLEQERQALETELRDRVIVNFRNFARKALVELADVTLENQIIAVLKKRYESLAESEKQRLTPTDPETADAYVVTTYDLSSQARAEIKALTAIENLVFKTDPHVVCGIELFVNGQVLSWNLDAYLHEFTESLKASMDSVSGNLASAEK